MNKLITDLRQAYIDVLAKHDKLYHFDDDPTDIPCFTQEEAAIVAQLSKALHSEELFDMAITKTDEKTALESDPTYCPF